MKMLFCLAMILVPTAIFGAVSINWRSDEGAAHLQSDGLTELDGDFEFLLGTFVGLTPTAENVSQWQAAFQVLGTTEYLVGLKRFTASTTLISNAAPFTTADRAYIWGRNGIGPGSEWVLFGKPSWKWPDANPVGPPPFPSNWLVASIAPGDVIVGKVNEGAVHLQTAIVEFDLSYPAWVDLNFEIGEESGAGSDFDEDGRPNFLEYALDSNPKAKDEPFQVVLSKELELGVPKVAGRVVQWVLQGSDDLVEFNDLEVGFEIVSDESDQVIFRLEPPGLGAAFFRVEARPLDQ